MAVGSAVTPVHEVVTKESAVTLGGKVFKVKPPAFLPVTEKQNKGAIDVKSDFLLTV